MMTKIHYKKNVWLITIIDTMTPYQDQNWKQKEYTQKCIQAYLYTHYGEYQKQKK